METAKGPKKIPTLQVVPNPENPRLIFDPDEMDALLKSINEVGILVPLIVFPVPNGKFSLLDGERRWRCARRLNLDEVPVNIIEPPSKVENILRMFNIHNVRQSWQLMPTAIKLGELMDYLHTQDDRALAAATGMTVSTVRRCKRLLKFPMRYQKALMDGEIKSDFLIEMYPVLTSVRKRFPNIYDGYGKDGLIDKFVSMSKHGKIKAVTDFRQISRIINGEKQGVGKEVIVKALERLFTDQNFTVKDAFEYTVSATYQTANILRKGEAFIRELDLYEPSKSEPKARKKLKSVLEHLREKIDGVLSGLN